MNDKIIAADYPSDGICRLTLNRPEANNAFSYEMYDLLLEELDRIGADLSIRAVIITGAGKSFCTGHDLRGAGENPHQLTGVGKLYANKHSMGRLGRIPVALRNLPQPVIAAVNGTAAGVGYALAVASDMAIAGASAKFVNAIHNAGTGHELGMSYLLPRLVGSSQAAELLYTARAVKADEAARIGLVLRTVPDGELLEAAVELGRQIAMNVPMGVWMTKQSLWLNQTAGSLEAAIELENRAVQIAQATSDAVEKRTAFVEKRPPRFNLS